MFLCSVDSTGRLLTIGYSGRVSVGSAKACVEAVRGLLGGVKPGFHLLVDMSHLEWMDFECAPELGAIMELCNARGLASVVRVIPDKSKDIGVNLMSHFHYSPSVRVHHFETLADAVSSLFAEFLQDPDGQ
jgi:hypothetical protein